MMCEEIDQDLLYKQLPAHMIVSGFIKGEEDCNYEVYLREYVNVSSFFKTLSLGEEYRAPCQESEGQPDAISSSYTLDFKLLASTTRMEATSILSNSIHKMADGVYSFGKSKKSGEKNYTLLCQAMRYKEEADFETIDNKRPNSFVEKDMKMFLKVLRTKKNILLFLPVEFSYKKDRPERDGIIGIQNALWYDLKTCMNYRERNVGMFDTHLATIYSEKVIIFTKEKDEFRCVDSIEISKSKAFMKLYTCGSFWE